MRKSKINKRRSKPITSFKGRGPIARKVIATAKAHLEKKVIDFANWKVGKLNAQALEASVIDHNELADFDLAHGAYVYAQNKMSVLIEQIIELPEVQKLAYAYDELMADYTPAYPPMSSITVSYFTSWATSDLVTQGAKKESLASIAVDFCRYMQVDSSLLNLYENLEQSRMGIYRHEGSDTQFVHLTELITNRKIKALRTTDYLGNVGELWFVRVLPPPFDAAHMDHHVVFTTPYVFVPNRNYDSVDKSIEEQWLVCFERIFPTLTVDTPVQAYEHFMRHGLSRNYWLEFIFLSYINHEDGAIFLGGYPDIRESLAHGELSSPESSGI